ncbi:hypothetical protein KIW84_065151 [Lathyrus oleraceus]|uniref:HAT C-terminal dimerisation domain-containing protein n=1 Tax=Pisum sativum TaxID=3888 RepID=A0A9D4WFW8_PEA|nr:hypothetical protein KIW84_065151 [Pisum sativum]
MYLPNPKSKLRSFLFFSTFPYWIKEKSVATLANRDIAIKTTKKSSSPYDRFEILSAINSVSQLLQEKNMLIDVAMQKIKGLISYFEGYRETSFYKVLINAKEIAVELNIAPIFPQRRIIKRKMKFDENLNILSVELSEEESFRVNYFLYLVDQAVVSLNKRFEQYQEYEKLKLLREMLPEETIRPTDTLLFLKGLDCFPNTVIAYRILLTIPVTVASAEKKFFKIEVVKNLLAVYHVTRKA